MYHRRFRKPSKPTIFALLMAGAVAFALLPRDFLAPLRKATQLIAVGQYGVTSMARGVSQSAKDLRSEPVPAAKHAEVVVARQAAENESLSLRQQLMQSQERVRELEQLRNRDQFPGNGRLIPARVVGWDAVPGRDSMVLLKPASRGVQQGDWVASRLAVQGGSEDGIREDVRVLARGTLIGWIEQTASLSSRVVLLSDRYSHRKWKVHIAAVGRPGRDNEYLMENGKPLDFALEGIGDGKMRIRDIPARYKNDELIRVGDVVTSDGQDPKLPLSMVIGEITKFEQIKKPPLLYNAIVKHRWDPKELSEVFIVDIPK